MEDSHKNQANQTEVGNPVSDISSLSLFNKSAHYAYVYKKTEKLVTAVYMITNFIKDNEPLKWKIRDNALNLLSLNITFNTASLSERRDLIKEYQALSLEIVSLSGIAHHSGLISEMNYRILSREFTHLVSVLEKDENKKEREETVILDPGFFNVSEDKKPLPPQQHASNPGMPKQGDSSPVLYTQPSAISDKGHTDASEVSHSVPVKDKRPEYLPVKDAPKQSRGADSKEGRQAVIVKLLTKKGGLNVNDFVESIKGVSVKTIQRELLSMVAAGILKKEGERRWSTYSLAK